jgi:hypothetical protein
MLTKNDGATKGGSGGGAVGSPHGGPGIETMAERTQKPDVVPKIENKNFC